MVSSNPKKPVLKAIIGTFISEFSARIGFNKRLREEKFALIQPLLSTTFAFASPEKDFKPVEVSTNFSALEVKPLKDSFSPFR